MTKARDISSLLSTANGKIAGANLDVSFENISDTGTQGTKVATGTTNQRGSTAGQIRFNTTTGLAEYYDGTVFKSIDTPPTVTAVSPLEVDSQAGGNITFTITGSNFQSGAVTKFIGTDGTEITASTTTVTNSTTISAVIARSSFVNAKEPYDVKIINTSGLSGILDNQISVDSSPTWITASGNLATILDNATGTHSTVSATDADGDTVSYSETGGTVLTTAGLTLNSSTGAISGDPTDVASATTYNFTLRATANSKTVDRAFNIIVNPALDGSTSQRASGSPTQIASVLGTTPTNGVYWYKNSGYNSNTPFQAYTDWSINSNTGYIILTQAQLSGAGITNFTDVGTNSSDISGTRGHNNTFREPTGTILNNWSGDTSNRCIVGQYQTSTGSSLATASYLQWIQLNVTPAIFKNMFDDVPSGGQFVGTISARSAGGTGNFYWSKSSSGEYPNHLQMHNAQSNGTWNNDNYIEIRSAGGDSNHGFFVKGDGTGTYYTASRSSTNGGSENRVGFFGFAPNNTV